jgi:hypothetical protein
LTQFGSAIYAATFRVESIEIQARNRTNIGQRLATSAGSSVATAVIVLAYR